VKVGDLVGISSTEIGDYGIDASWISDSEDLGIDDPGALMIMETAITDRGKILVKYWRVDGDDGPYDSHAMPWCDVEEFGFEVISESR